MLIKWVPYPSISDQHWYAFMFFTYTLIKFYIIVKLWLSWLTASDASLDLSMAVYHSIVLYVCALSYHISTYHDKMNDIFIFSDIKTRVFYIPIMTNMLTKWVPYPSVSDQYWYALMFFTCTLIKIYMIVKLWLHGWQLVTQVWISTWL